MIYLGTRRMHPTVGRLALGMVSLGLAIFAAASSAQAALLVYEPFDYTVAPFPGPGLLFGQGGSSDFGYRTVGAPLGTLWNQGTGTAPLDSSTAAPRLLRGGLDPTNTLGLAPIGNGVTGIFDTTSHFADRHLATAIGDDTFGTNPTIYLSYIIQVSYPRLATFVSLGTDGSGGTLANAVPVVIAGSGTSVPTGVGIAGSGTTVSPPNNAAGTFAGLVAGVANPVGGSGVAPAYNTAQHLVMEMNFDGTAGASSDTYRVWLNPTLNGGVPDPGNIIVASTAAQLGTFNEMRVQVLSSGIDEIRVGTTWSDVFSAQTDTNGNGNTHLQPVAGGTVIARGTKDANFGAGGDSNAGGTATLQPRYRASGAESGAIVDFQNVQTLIPGGATITSAKLIMEKNWDSLADVDSDTVFDNPNDGVGNYDEHVKVWRVGEAWTEGFAVNGQNDVAPFTGVTWTNADKNVPTPWTQGISIASGGGGYYFDTAGQQVEAGSSYRNSPRDSENVVGGEDLVPYALANFTNDAQTYELDVLQLVQEWYAGTYTQYGMMLTSWVTSGGGTGISFMSTETAGAYANGLEPHLVITYTLDAEVVPEPSSIALSALGLIGLGWFGWSRRRRG